MVKKTRKKLRLSAAERSRRSRQARINFGKRKPLKRSRSNIKSMAKKKFSKRSTSKGFGSIGASIKRFIPKAVKGTVYASIAVALAPTLQQLINQFGGGFNITLDPKLLRIIGAYTGGGVEGVVGDMLFSGGLQLGGLGGGTTTTSTTQNDGWG